MIRDRIEFYQGNESLPDVVLIEDYPESAPDVGRKMRLLQANMKDLPKDNPALVAMEYVLAYKGARDEFFISKPGVCKPEAWTVRCWPTRLQVERVRQGRKVA